MNDHHHPSHANVPVVPLQSVTLLLGSPFSGSSLLGQSLNDIAGIAYAGELDRLHAFGFALHRASDHYNSGCSICRTHQNYDCPVFQLPASAVPHSDAFAIEDYVSVLARFGVPHVVDGSKNVDWLWHLKGRGLLDALPTRVILTTRSVWGFVASQRREGLSDPYQAAEGWRNIYRHALRSISSLMVPSLLLRHEMFVDDQDKWLSRAAWFVADTPHNLYEPKPLHAIGGNTSAHLIRPEFDRSGHLDMISEQFRPRARDKIAYFGGSEAPRANAVQRWAHDLTPDEAYNVLALPGVLETMLDLGYDPLRMLDEYKALRAA